MFRKTPLEKRPPHEWGVGDRQIFAQADVDYWTKMMMLWGISFAFVAVIAHLLESIGLNFAQCSAYKLLGQFIPGVRLHVDGARFSNIAALLWTYGMFALPLMVWHTTHVVQNFRIPTNRADYRMMILLFLLTFPLGVSHIFLSRLFFVFPIPPLPQLKMGIARAYTNTLVGTVVVSAILFTGAFAIITLACFWIREITQNKEHRET